MSKKLHILFLSSWYPSRVLPTNGDFVQRHAEAIATEHQITLIHVVTDKNIAVSETIESIINNVKTIIIYVPYKNPILKFYTFYKIYLSTINKIENFDLVHLNITYPKGLIALYLKKYKQKPYIITEHWTGYQYPLNKSIGFLRKKITEKITTNAAFICPVSKKLQSDMLLFGLKGNYRPIPNVVNTDLFFPVEKTHKTFIITHVSSFNNKQKNITGILNVIKQLSEKRSDFIFNLAGNGEYNYIKKYIKKLEIPSENIKIIETKTQEEIAQILQRTDLYISFSNYETFGIVMTEALATGTPVTSTNTGVLTELDATEFSSIIPIKDEKSLLKNISNHLENNRTYDVEKMHLLIEQNFSKTRVCDSFTKVYLEALKKTNS